MFKIIYTLQHKTIIRAVMIDSRATELPALASGSVVDQKILAVSSLVTSDVLFYKVESPSGNLVGYFALKVNAAGTSATLFFKLMRSTFVGVQSSINQAISNHVTSKQWANDFL